jgi:hypothetical protein
MIWPKRGEHTYASVSFQPFFYSKQAAVSRVQGKEIYIDCRKRVCTITCSWHVWLKPSRSCCRCCVTPTLVMFSVRRLAEVSKHDILYLPNMQLTRQLPYRTDQQVMQQNIPLSWRHYSITIMSLVFFHNIFSYTVFLGIS